MILAVAAALALVVIGLSRHRDLDVARVSQGCNGDQRLCGARLDEVAFPGTHNSMGSVDTPGFMFPQQERGVAGQLEDGVRAMLIDVYAGFPVAGGVKTDLRVGAGVLAKMEEAVGEEGMLAVQRVRERMVGPVQGPRSLYLCHGFCEVGALPLVPWLHILQGFLVANPREVVILVIEDYVPPQELAAAFEESGLSELVYRGRAGRPWPTLGEMVVSGQRVLAFLESGKPGVDWLYPAFDEIQETPFRFLDPAQLSCIVHRGGTSGSLFQLNHWIETAPMPRPSNAAIVNAYDFLLGRARKCEQERGLLPNIVAVDFYRTGDLFRVVRTLNRLDGSVDQARPGPSP